MSSLAGKKIMVKPSWRTNVAGYEAEVISVDFSNRIGWMLLIKTGNSLSQIDLASYIVEVVP